MGFVNCKGYNKMLQAIDLFTIPDLSWVSLTIYHWYMNALTRYVDFLNLVSIHVLNATMKEVDEQIP